MKYHGTLNFCTGQTLSQKLSICFMWKLAFDVEISFKTEHLSLLLFLWIFKYFENRSHLVLLYWHLKMLPKFILRGYLVQVDWFHTRNFLFVQNRLAFWSIQHFFVCHDRESKFMKLQGCHFDFLWPNLTNLAFLKLFARNKMVWPFWPFPVLVDKNQTF